jgi:Amt family ammonium transporter
MEVPEVSTEMVTAINTIWVLVTAFLVFFMQPGFAVLEAGLIRVKNVGNILMRKFLPVEGAIRIRTGEEGERAI